jgi:flavin reductase (DIM6/NTAB) family NADH-FMN oxidoreductase RutF
LWPGSPAPRPAYDRRVTSGDDLRALMRRFPAGVAVLTTEAEGERVGATIGSLVSLSLEPPLVGVSIGKQGSLHEPLRQADGFAISLLGEGQEGLAQHFARSGIPPLALWVGVETRDGLQGPLLEDAIGWLECRTGDRHDAGDHTFFVGEVLSLELGRPARPLVYLDREYLAP